MSRDLTRFNIRPRRLARMSVWLRVEANGSKLIHDATRTRRVSACELGGRASECAVVRREDTLVCSIGHDTFCRAKFSPTTKVKRTKKKAGRDVDLVHRVKISCPPAIS